MITEQMKDLSMRLPYKVKVEICDGFDSNIEILTEIDIEANRINGEIDTFYCIDNVKPFLRPMLSMTEEEREVYLSLQERCLNCCEFGDVVDDFLYFDNYGSLDYLNSIHVDYRGLIEKGLALEAPEGMY